MMGGGVKKWQNSVHVVVECPLCLAISSAVHYIFSYLFLELAILCCSVFIIDVHHIGLSLLNLKIFHRPWNGQIYMSKTVVMT